jgi:hypothetical protein
VESSAPACSCESFLLVQLSGTNIWWFSRPFWLQLQRNVRFLGLLIQNNFNCLFFTQLYYSLNVPLSPQLPGELEGLKPREDSSSQPTLSSKESHMPNHQLVLSDSKIQCQRVHGLAPEKQLHMEITAQTVWVSTLEAIQ